VSIGRVLVIEDDAKIGKILERGLGLKDIDVTLAQDGFVGRETWSSGRFDLVLLDVMLPGIDGISLCAERRAAGDTTPVILLTARGEEDARERGMAAGATDYVTKPFAYADLLARVLELLPARP
jgi:two-component system, OmpR family, copper resistance phosphate regulon response regulator CusR